MVHETTQPTEAPEAPAVVAEQQNAQEETPAEEEVYPAVIQVTLLIPHQSFVKLAKATLPPAGSDFLELPLPLGLSDSVHELRQMIVESPEGFWLGAFGFVPVVAHVVEDAKEGTEATWGPWENLPQPKAESKAAALDASLWRLTSEGVLGDFSDLSAVFGGNFDGRKRGLRVVQTAFTHLSMSLHLLRLRDTLYSTLPSLSSNLSYDPSSIAIAAGSTLYSSIRGPLDSPEGEQEDDETEDTRKGKKGASTKKTPTPLAEPDTTHAFTNWTIEDLDPFSAFDNLRPATSSSTATPCLRNFSVSGWSPVPHARRMRGDLIYLATSTYEGETFTITGATNGFWISKSTAGTFDPLPKSPPPRDLKSTPYHSLFELLGALSPTFIKGLARLVESQSPSSPTTDIYASIPITNSIPAAPWLVPAPIHTSDSFRTQLAFLLTGTTNAELLPPARDWNDELAQYKELEKATFAEKLLRERLLNRVRADFVAAATRGALSIARGDVPPLNPNEPEEAHTFIHNQMLFTRADDAIHAFSHLGGNEAARVAAGKDLAGVNLLERLDVDGINTMATVLVDFAGQRWIVQSVIPGLFKSKPDEEILAAEEDSKTEVVPTEEEKDATTVEATISDHSISKDDSPPSGIFRIVYGSSNPETPDESIRSADYFHKLAREVAEKMHLAEHTVYNAAGSPSKLFTSTDMHGIAAPDGRSYFVDCFRLHCVDEVFLTKYLDCPPFADPSAPSTDRPSIPYPHRLVLLRPELLAAYHSFKLHEWLDVRVAAAAAEVEASKEKLAIESAKSEAGGSAPSDPTSSAPEKKAPTPVAIDAAEFLLDFNPDAFVERNAPTSSSSTFIYDPEEASTKAVHDASSWLNDSVLSNFVLDIVSNMLVTDGFFLTKLMHRKGINMRYLGVLVDIVEQNLTKTSFGDVLAPDAHFVLRAFKDTLRHEMVSRACKHILNTLLRTSMTYDHPNLVAHFCNCLLGSALEAHPVAEVVDLPSGVVAERAWTSLTPESLRQQITLEVEARFRYTLPSTYFDTKIVPNRLLRELCLRVGIQLVLRKYNFDAPSGSAVANGVQTSDEEKVESTAETTSAAPKRRKKKSASKLKKEAKKHETRQELSVRPEDVLNIYPIVKATQPKSNLADENFNAGAGYLSEGNVEVGQNMIQDSLQLCEQVFGTVHADVTSKYHTFGLLLNQLSQSILRRVVRHEKTMEDLASLPPADRAAAAQLLADRLLSDVEAARAEAGNFAQSAVRMVRQSLVIAERTFGLDSPDTIQQYTDLGLLEQAAGNVPVGLRLMKHAMGLWTAAYGHHHPSTLNLLTNAATMVQSHYGLQASVPLLTECVKLAQIIHGTESIPYATNRYALGQAYAVLGDLPTCLEHSAEASRLFNKLLGTDSPDSIEVANFTSVIREAVTQGATEQINKEQRLRQKIPRLMADKEVKPSVKSNGVATPLVEEPVVQKEHGQKANLSVDELVSFIQGTPLAGSRASRKRKGSPPSVAA